MIDPRVALVVGALLLTVWGVGKVVHGAEWLAHTAKAAIVRVVHPSKDLTR